MSTKRYAMAVDTKKCVGCNACVIACKSENQVPLHYFRDWVEEELTGEYPHLFMEVPVSTLQPVLEAGLRERLPHGRKPGLRGRDRPRR